MNTLYLSFLLFSIFIIIFFCLSLIIKDKLYISETIFSFIYGIIIAKTNLLIIDNKLLKTILFHFSRILMTLQVVAVGTYVSEKYILNEYKSILMLIFPVSLCSLFVSTGLVYFVSNILFNNIQLTWLECFIVGACVTPTDPVLASVVLKGKFANKYIPKHLRNLLMVESGANDGMGWPMLASPIIILRVMSQISNNFNGIISNEKNSNGITNIDNDSSLLSTNNMLSNNINNNENNKSLTYNKLRNNKKRLIIKEVLKSFILKTLLYEIICSILLGTAIGFIFKTLYIFCKSHSLIDKESSLSFMLIITTFSIGLHTLFHLNDILASFFVGLSFTYNNIYLENIKEMHFLEVIDLLFTLNFFILFGLYMDLNMFFNIRNNVISISIILIRRLPVILLFYNLKLIPQLFNLKEAVLTGWFGPIGCGAIFFILEAESELNIIKDKLFKKELMEIVLVIVCYSVIVHGITAPFVALSLRRKGSKKVIVLEEESNSDYTENAEDVFGMDIN
ncbi:putative Na(+)/H(+) antiporter C3A11.09 [Cucumispora dikerogammari]|nr:putative Na(+)/H(+) antiporter C3A11.09 [Cucumispora dikerogammari]